MKVRALANAWAMKGASVLFFILGISFFLNAVYGQWAFDFSKGGASYVLLDVLLGIGCWMVSYFFWKVAEQHEMRFVSEMTAHFALPTMSDAGRAIVSNEEDVGVAVPAWWYCWPIERDWKHQAEMREWHEKALRGQDADMPMPDPNRAVFLPENMPPELQGKSSAELTAAGVMQIDGEHAMQFLIDAYEAERGIHLSPSGRLDFIAQHLALIGWKTEGPPVQPAISR
jgi:hypothetical protein